MAFSLYYVLFSYPKRAVELFLKAHSKKQAWVMMCHALANRDGVDPSIVFRMFDWEKQDNFTIKTEIEYKEIDDEK